MQSTQQLADLSFHYGYTRVCEMRVLDAAAGGPSAKATPTLLEVDDRRVAPTRRFWRSFFHRFGVSESVFRYFDPGEVFHRISQRAADDHIRYCIESNAAGSGSDRLLAASSPKRPVMECGEVLGLVERYGGDDLRYAEGVITSRHAPRSGEDTYRIGGDQFQNRFVLEQPVDGFSHPKIYLSLLRMICSNGAIGYSRAFRSDVSLGKDLAHCVARALESFDHDEGYAALRQRFESAQKSWASVAECNALYKLLLKLNMERADAASGGRRSRLLADLYRVTGNLNELYGLANLDALSEKRQRILPSRARVYDLINFASELATHHARPLPARMIQAYIGRLISDEYDMEGTAENVTEFADFFVAAPEAGPAASVN